MNNSVVCVVSCLLFSMSFFSKLIRCQTATVILGRSNRNKIISFKTFRRGHINAENEDKFIEYKQSFRGAEYLVAATLSSLLSLCSRNFFSKVARLKSI